MPIENMAKRTVLISNRSNAQVHLIIEPVADTYRLDAGEGLTLSFDEGENTPAIEVEYHATGDIGVWTHAITQAYKGEVLVAPA